MGYRKEITYLWEENNIDSNEIIPPAIIHTAVENGVSHSIPNEDGTIKFELNFERQKKSKSYSLKTFAKNRTSNNELKEVSDGTGMKYIKSRLQESYGDNWELKSFKTAEGWETNIKIMN